MRIIGDVHGHLQQFERLVEDTQHFIQLGDFGFREEHEWFLQKKYSEGKILFGNHDYYPYVSCTHSLGDYTAVLCEGTRYLTIRGAYSPDNTLRTEGVDWFREEELSYATFMDILCIVQDISPDIILSHDCPQRIREQFFGIHDPSRTSQGLQAVFEAFQPSLWVFGHHHQSRNEVVNGTRFICLRELEVRDI
jgi:predicted phosphodiesterase